MSKIGDVIVRLLLQNKDYEDGLKKSQSGTNSFVSSVQKGLSKAVASFASLAAVVKGLSDSIKTLAGFERANSELAAVLGTTKKGVEELTKAAMDLGRVTSFTASDVTSLQTSLARLGFGQGEILDMQESVLKFAAAVGTDLASAADFSGSALRAFGLTSTDTRDLLDIMAASTSNSALSFSKLQESVSTVGPVASAFGLSARDTVTLLGALSNAGFDAGSAATALRNILLNLADSNGKLAQGLGHTANTMPEIMDALVELRDRGVDLNETLGMTDKRSVAAFTALLQGADDVRQLYENLGDCNGALDQMYGTMEDNLIGAVNGLKSAWEGLILQFQSSTGPMADVVRGLTDILNRLTDIVSGKEKVSFWEAVLGPITGGWIASWRQKRKGAQGASAGGDGLGGPTSPTGGAGASGGGAGGGEKPNTPKTKPTLPGGPGGKKKPGRGEWGDTIEAVTSEIPVQKLEKIAEEVDRIQTQIDDRIAEGAEAWARNMAKFGEAADELAQSLQSGVMATIDELAAQLFNPEGFDAGAVIKALISPLADAAISAGMIIMATGKGIEALKAGLVSFFGGNAIAAGAALIAVGAAAKVGLAALASSGAAGSAAATPAAASAASAGGASSVNATSEITVHVEGRIKGSDIVLAGSRTQNSWGR